MQLSSNNTTGSNTTGSYFRYFVNKYNSDTTTIFNGSNNSGGSPHISSYSTTGAQYLVNIRCIFVGSFGIMYDANAPEGYTDAQVQNMSYGNSITTATETSHYFALDALPTNLSDDPFNPVYSCGWSLDPYATCASEGLLVPRQDTGYVTLGEGGLPRRITLYAIWNTSTGAPEEDTP